MALFIGGPADGWRIEVEPDKARVEIAINPHPPAFTPDSAVMSASTSPVFVYRMETIVCSGEKYTVYVPETWACDAILCALLSGYKQAENKERLNYIRTAKGTMYTNDDRSPDGRPYKV